MLPFPMKVRNYRSIEDEIVFPFSKRITYLAGPNNVGKSNAIRALALIANKANNHVAPTDHTGAPGVRITMDVPATYMIERLSALPTAVTILKSRAQSELPISFSLHNGGLELSQDTLPTAIEYFQSYLNNSNFLREMGQSSNTQSNAISVLQKLNLLENLKGSTHLPHLRFITQQGQEPPRYLATKMPGETIAFGSVISRLAEMDRPVPSQRHLSGQLRQIEDFMAFCLERGTVSIEVSHDRSTVTVSVDGEERSLGDLGTGLEQLLMVGLASMGFPGKLVLIDEPELHLHPRAQKRMMKYLSDNVDAQFVIATHSSAILDAVEADIIHISRSGARSKTHTIASAGDRYRAVRDLGHTPSELVLSRFVIWVEGPSDRIYLNYWINRTNSDLVEGIDYSILFYGGSILAQHSYADEDAEGEESRFVRALSVAREFAVLIDSDLHPGKPALRATKLRIKNEVESVGGFCWITDGREVENYLPIGTQKTLAEEFSYVTPSTDKSAQILNPDKASKVNVALRAVNIKDHEWTLDLQEKIEILIDRILSAK